MNAPAAASPRHFRDDRYKAGIRARRLVCVFDLLRNRAGRIAFPRWGVFLRAVAAALCGSAA